MKPLRVLLLIPLLFAFSVNAAPCVCSKDQSLGARTDNFWNNSASDTYLYPNKTTGYGLLLTGTGKYLGFGSTYGSSGYGFRDNAGSMEFKNSGGAWAAFGTGAGGVSSITGTADQVIASTSTGDITLSLPQSIAITSAPTFAGITSLGEVKLNMEDGTGINFANLADTNNFSYLFSNATNTLTLTSDDVGSTIGGVILDLSLLTPSAPRTQKFPDKDGTFAMTSDFSGYFNATSSIDHNTLANLDAGSSYLHLTTLQKATSTRPANASQDGYCSKEDWSTFNNKMSTSGHTATSVQTYDASGGATDVALSQNSLLGRILDIIVPVPIDSDLTTTSSGDDTVPSAKATKTYADTKQATLVSGTNIKTINSNSLLGSGDLSISAAAAGSNSWVQYNNGGALGATSTMSYNKDSGTLTLSGNPQYIGADIVTNGTFTATSSPWVLGNNVTWSNGSVTSTYAGGSTSIKQDVTVVEGTSYLISFTVSNASSTIYVTDDNNLLFYVDVGNGSYKLSYTQPIGYGTLFTLYFNLNNSLPGETFTLSNVSMIPILTPQPSLLVRGYDNQNILSIGANNTLNNLFFGYNSGQLNTTGYNNVFMGYSSGYNNTTGYGNVFMGKSSGYNNTTGDGNVFMGRSSGYNNTTGDGNVFMGYSSGYNNTVGTDNVFLGIYSGFNSTASSTLIIDNQDRGSSANELTNSLLYGTFNATPSLQTLAVNATLNTLKFGVGTTTPAYASEVVGTSTVRTGSFYVKGSSANGLILTSPNGLCHMISVSNTNVLSAATTTCP